MTSKIKISTPEILWHGGGNENGKPDPVYAVDFHPYGVLATAGIDANLPAKGSVRLWKIDPNSDETEYLIEFNDHPSSINTIKFSPCGKLLASASDRQIIVYAVNNPSRWQELSDVKDVERVWISPNLDEIYDLQWSPDCSHIIAGALNSKAEIIRVGTRETYLLTGHTSYVQGVAWDPSNKFVITQSADRSCRFHYIKSSKTNKISPKGETVLRTNSQSSRLLFADSTVPCFFRRPSFSPDGELIFIPTGIYRPAWKPDSGLPRPPQTFCSYIVSRNHLSSPLVCLAGLEEPSVGIRCSPVLYRLVYHGDVQPMIGGNYRFVFAVITTTAIYIYDTQHEHPLVRITGCHLATINDATWSPDGNLLVVCSSDGYITFVRFLPGSLGEQIPKEEVPESVKKTLPLIYDYEISSSPIDAILQADAASSIISPTQEPIAISVGIDNEQAENNIGNIVQSLNDDEMVVVDSDFLTPPKDSDIDDLFTDEEVNHISKLVSPPGTLSSTKSFDCSLSESSYASSTVIGVNFLSNSTDIQLSSPSKKRRIVPIQVDRNGRGINNSSNSPECESKSENYSTENIDTCPSNLAADVSVETQLLKKEKKRIAPVLVTSFMKPLQTATSSSSSSSSSSYDRME